MANTPIIQFGTSRFLQAHVDLFVSESTNSGQITVVQTSGDATRARRLNAFTQSFPVRIEGLRDGVAIQEEKNVSSISRALSTTVDWNEITRVFVEEASFVLSNTGDSGYDPCLFDSDPSFHQEMSFPAKLNQLLFHRFQNGARPIQIMPMELIENNGAVLKARVTELATPFGLRYLHYIAEQVIWVNSLVDRIVSEPIEPVGAVAEPYALWAIESQPGLQVPCKHPAIQVVPSLAIVEALKLFVLNLGHTFMANNWLAAEGNRELMVRDIMQNPDDRTALEDLYQTEVRPAFLAAGHEALIDPYIKTTLERFANPYLAHRISDIAQNHTIKVERRIAAFLKFAEKHSDPTPKPILSGIVEQLAGQPL